MTGGIKGRKIRDRSIQANTGQYRPTQSGYVKRSFRVGYNARRGLGLKLSLASCQSMADRTDENPGARCGFAVARS